LPDDRFFRSFDIAPFSYLPDDGRYFYISTGQW
jgi:hypothetical protein